MNKQLIISYYDSGYYWSFASGNRIYTRDAYEENRIKSEKIKKLANLVDKFDASLLKYIAENYPECSRIILCENGRIEILNKGKGGLFNAH